MPSWRDLKRFCEQDGWELYKSTDHDFCMKRNDDGLLKRTKVSRGAGEIGQAPLNLNPHNIAFLQLLFTKLNFNKLHICNGRDGVFCLYRNMNHATGTRI